MPLCKGHNVDVWGLGFRVRDLGLGMFRIWGSRLRVPVANRGARNMKWKLRLHNLKP